jgi:YgiT-type zinc finger domain-containing protein
MTDKRDLMTPKESCPECQAGALQNSAVPYYAILEGTLVVVPDFPAWVCDICRHCEYDENALEALRVILGPAAHIPSQSNPRRRLPAEDLSPWPRDGTRRGSK